MNSDKMTNNDLQNNYQQNITFIFTNTTIQNKLHLQTEHSKLNLQTKQNKLHLQTVHSKLHLQTEHNKLYLQTEDNRLHLPLNRNESGRFGALKSDSTHHFFRNACTKSGSLRFSQFSGC